MKRLSDIFENKKAITMREKSFVIEGYNEPFEIRKNHSGEKLRVNILAMGDVGSTLTLAMKLMGGDIVSQIGICDINENTLLRFESEFNQISMPEEFYAFPNVVPVSSEDLFDCDAFVFCASKGVPPVNGAKDTDVRMVQLESNVELVKHFAKQAASQNYNGEFFVVSDPVDPLCKGALLAGIASKRIQGFGLGVMNGRAAYYAKKHTKLSQYITEGRAFGPHGEDLIIADSIENYNHELSKELTQLTVTSNLKTRELGFKPYIAPAVSSGAISILENLRGNWHYSSAYFGIGNDGAFLGAKNRRCSLGLEIENLTLDDLLFERIEKAYNNLKELI